VDAIVEEHKADPEQKSTADIKSVFQGLEITKRDAKAPPKVKIASDIKYGISAS
jgi:hypothetical protein